MSLSELPGSDLLEACTNTEDRWRLARLLHNPGVQAGYAAEASDRIIESTRGRLLSGVVVVLPKEE